MTGQELARERTLLVHHRHIVEDELKHAERRVREVLGGLENVTIYVRLLYDLWIEAEGRWLPRYRHLRLDQFVTQSQIRLTTEVIRYTGFEFGVVAQSSWWRRFCVEQIGGRIFRFTPLHIDRLDDDPSQWKWALFLIARKRILLRGTVTSGVFGKPQVTAEGCRTVSARECDALRFGVSQFIDTVWEVVRGGKPPRYS